FMLNRRCGLYKLLGCGKNGTFDLHPDWRQWGTLVIEKTNPEPQTSNLETQTSNFIKAWFRFFHCEVWTIVLEPIEGHGTWDGKKAFGELPKQTDYEGPIATLTRATIRIKRLKNFWKHVDAAAAEMRAAPGFITSIGIGELPWIKQATFSVWQSKADMKNFAYKMQHHAEVIRKTRKENWYSEDMFVRFKVISAGGNLSGKNPLQGIL
ncbi:MAG TPA: spheroidene monooxygenase, partial [Chitinophagaceae bacterium]|nr:spheroidene monooxygenase [Chitinophagaceae bacterium]